MGICYFCGKHQIKFEHSLNGKVPLCKECFDETHFYCKGCSSHHIRALSINNGNRKTLKTLDPPIENVDILMCYPCYNVAMDNYIKNGKSCEHCGRLTLFSSTKGDYCSVCDAEAIQCTDCNAWSLNTHNVTKENGECAIVCSKCIESVKYLHCNNCETIFTRDWNRLYNSKTILCPKCELKYKHCDMCGYIRRKTDFKDGGSECSYCYGRKRNCVKCGREIYPDNTGVYKEGPDGLYCVQCLAKEGFAEEERWDYVPPIFHYHGKNNNQLYLGFENEVRVPPSTGMLKYKVLAQILAAYPPEIIYSVFDGSIGGQKDEHCQYGFEIVSHPMTLTTIKKIKWGKMFHPAIRPHDTTGMHIHLTRNAFRTVHLYKFLSFIHDNETLIDWIAQRPPNIYCKNLRENDLDHDSKMGIKKKGPNDIYRRAKINLCNPHTIEMRFFNAVNNENDLFKNLEFAHCSYFFTKYHRRRESLNTSSFLIYLNENKNRYPSLFNWIKENPVPDKYPYKRSKFVNNYHDEVTIEEVNGELTSNVEAVHNTLGNTAIPTTPPVFNWGTNTTATTNIFTQTLTTGTQNEGGE